ncbi:hypothetical protein JCM8097_005062 [Rhodosporidiobolus ruineniae]
MFGYDPYGLVFYHPDQHRLVSLPLLEVSADASILDLSAQVNLTERYRNESSDTVECSYVFPVPARGAVCAFAMVKEDGTKVVGVVEEKEQARKTYEEAVEAGKLASLTEQATPDTFKCSVGNILPNETVTIELTYATELTEGETSDSIRFHLPSRVGARYGGPPAGLFGAAAPVAQTASNAPFDLRVNIELASPISKISCPSHAVETSLGPPSSPPNASSLPFAHYARLSFSTPTTLERDFILELHSPGLDKPRCLAERHPVADTAAVSLTLVPRFKLPDVEGQEFVFLVDRSGSMQGSRIEMARKALVVLLRSLPHKGTAFNVVSFGSSNQHLWPEGSRPYNQSTLDEATRHVDSMQADFGGTETRSALEAVFEKRKSDRPTAVFLLTDGDSWDLDAVYASVKSAVAASSADTPLRVFVLGIGNSASTAMCDGIARHGQGVAQYATDGESLTGKTTRLLRAARTPVIRNARLDFGVDVKEAVEDDFEMVEAEKEEPVKPAAEPPAASVNLFDNNVDPLAVEKDEPAPPPEPVHLSSPPAVQQTPARIRNLYPGTRLHAYAILSPASLLPASVWLRGELASGQKVELEIPITESKSPLSAANSSVPPPIHTLAARKLIQDLEDGEYDLSSPLLSSSSSKGKKEKADADLLNRTIKAAVVRLGTTYSLASTHTSFVAVDESETGSPEAAEKRKRKAKRVAVPVFPPPPPPGAARPMALFAAAPVSASRGMRRCRGMVSASPDLGAVPPPQPAPAPAAAAAFGYGAAAAPATSGGLFGSASTRGGLFDAADAAALPAAGSLFDAPKMPGAGSLFANRTPGSGPIFGRAAASAAPPAAAVEEKKPDPDALSPSDRLDALARLQAFDGSFAPLDAVLPLCALDGRTAEELAEKLPATVKEKLVDEGTKEKVLLATLVVLAFWEREMSGLKDEWEEMSLKAKKYVGAALGKEEDEVEELVKLF